jgi:hypothetical protein
VRLSTEQHAEKPNPTFIAEGNTAAAWLAEHTGGIAQSMVPEALANIPTTAHILGGAVIGADARAAWWTRDGRVFGYASLLVCDGSIMPANPGRQSQPDHHRAGRTCHEPRAASEMLLSRLPRTISCKSAKMRTPTVRHEA